MLINTSRPFPLLGVFCHVILLGNRWRCAFVGQSLDVPHTRQILWGVETVASTGAPHRDPNRQSGQIYAHTEVFMIRLTSNTVILSFFLSLFVSFFLSYTHTRTSARAHTHTHKHYKSTRTHFEIFLHPLI